MSAEPDKQDLTNLTAGLFALTAAFIGLQGSFNFSSVTNGFLAGFLALGARELGQRSVAQQIRAKVDVKLSKPGLALTLLGAVAGFFSSYPLALIFPLFNSYSNDRYESWGRDIDVVWTKRRYWIASMGMIAMLSTAFITYSLGAFMISKSISLFVLFQLIPLKETPLIDGDLDGAHILIHSGFAWVGFIAFGILGLALPL
ncbi:hypothetical protein [Candidatus Nanohalococcus occultus]|uniref:hypothetical protein n=1 Tax=Candidatus Nanohalococcus occultus TaxID=2978047 RepID=UPI0039E0721C